MAARRIPGIDLPPDAFAIVMATGILSVAAGDHQYRYLHAALAGIATVLFVGLAAIVGLRIVLRPRVLAAQAHDPDVALRMFTFVAAATVLGVVWSGFPTLVSALALLASIGWGVLAPLAVRDVRSRPRDVLRDHAHGAWLLSSVGTAGLATTAADLGMLHGAPVLTVVGVVLWLVGLGLYLAVTCLIVRRALGTPLRPEEMTPDAWILMGAMAIGALTGNHLLSAADRFAMGWLSAWARPLTLAVWIVATAWIPFLLYAEMWRVDQRAGSLRFAGVWWSAVFPLGMYASATSAIGDSFVLPELHTVSLVFFWIGMTAWTLVAVGQLHFGLASWRARPR